MNVMRFDFTNLQDFRQPVAPVAMVEEAEDEKEEAAPPPPPTFSQAELDAAKSAEYQRGHADGLKDGHAQAQSEDVQCNQQIDAALKTVVSQVAMLDAQFKALLAQQCDELSQLVMLVGRKVAGDAISHIPEAGVVSVIKDCLPIIIHQPRIQLTVHSSLAEIMRGRMQAMIAHMGLECSCQVMGEENINVSECRLEWQDGVAERDLSSLWDAIEEKLNDIDFSQAVSGLDTQDIPIQETPEAIAEDDLLPEAVQAQKEINQPAVDEASAAPTTDNNKGDKQ